MRTLLPPLVTLLLSGCATAPAERAAPLPSRAPRDAARPPPDAAAASRVDLRPDFADGLGSDTFTFSTRSAYPVATYDVAGNGAPACAAAGERRADWRVSRCIVGVIEITPA